MKTFAATLLTAALAFLLVLPAVPAAEETSAPPPDADKSSFLYGNWRGAKLRCRKEEGKAVRCGKPEPFDVVFHEDGTGTSADDKFPSSFTYAWKSGTEITVTPEGGGDELKLFQLEHDEGFLTFQAYIYLPVENPDLPAEVNYIHYIFDVSRED